MSDLSRRPSQGWSIIWSSLLCPEYSAFGTIYTYHGVFRKVSAREGNKIKNSSFPTRSSLRYFGFISNLRRAKAIHRLCECYHDIRVSRRLTVSCSRLCSKNVFSPVLTTIFLSPGQPAPQTAQQIVGRARVGLSWASWYFIFKHPVVVPLLFPEGRFVQQECQSRPRQLGLAD